MNTDEIEIADCTADYDHKCRDAREQMVRDVEDGKILPVDAEHEAKKTGLPPFCQSVDDPGAVFDWDQHRTDIPLSLAIMWVAWRDRARVGLAWERYSVWGRAIYAEAAAPDQDASYQDAEQELWEALRNGAVQASGIAPDGDRYRSIASAEWLNARVFHDGRAGMVGPTVSAWTFGQVVVPKAALFEAWKPIALKGKPGRKNRQDAYKAEAIRMREAGFEGNLLQPLLDWAEENLRPEDQMTQRSLQTRISEWKL